MAITPFEFMIMENCGLINTKLGSKNAVYKSLENMRIQRVRITPEIIESLLAQAHLTAADLNSADQCRLNSYLTT